MALTVKHCSEARLPFPFAVVFNEKNSSLTACDYVYAHTYIFYEVQEATLALACFVSVSPFLPTPPAKISIRLFFPFLHLTTLVRMIIFPTQLAKVS